MSCKIAFITSHYLCEPTRQAIQRIKPDFDYIVVPYNNFTHITQVYEQYADSYDGFMVSGQSAMNIIELSSQKAVKPMASFQIDAAALYKSLLLICLKDRNQDLNRVYMDAMLPFGEKNSIADFLYYTEQSHLGIEISDWIRQIGPEKIANLEKYLVERIEDLWNENAFDLIVCEYSSIIPELEARGIPFLYPFISDKELAAAINELQVRIELEHLKSNLPAYVYVIAKKGFETPEQHEQLFNALKGYFSDNLVNCEIRRESDILCAELTVQKIRYFTQNGTCCRISEYLNEHLEFEVVTGYGIGSIPEQAMNNALAAAKEAALRGRSFLKDETGNLVGPLGAENKMVISSTPQYDVGQIANHAGLSIMTIQKLMTIIEINESNKMTSQELSRNFEVTVRNANRILSNLEKAGYAHVVYSRTSSTKGRPSKVYELDFRKKTPQKQI